MSAACPELLARLGVRPSRVNLVKAAVCTPNTFRTLRGKMDVDIIGYPDDARKDFSSVRANVKCGR